MGAIAILRHMLPRRGESPLQYIRSIVPLAVVGYVGGTYLGNKIVEPFLPECTCKRDCKRCNVLGRR